MIDTSILKMFSFRHAVGVAAAVFLAMLIDFHCFAGDASWIVIATFLVSQTTRGTPLRQNIIFILITISMVIIATSLAVYLTPLFVISILFLLYGAIAFTVLRHPYVSPLFLYILMLMLSAMCVQAFFMPTNFMVMRTQLFHIVIGSLVGILSGQLILPVQFIKEFFYSASTRLKIVNKYLTTLNNHLVRHSTQNVEIYLPSLMPPDVLQQNIYPEWAYEVGFNPGLRAGFRFFLLNIEYINEILFSIHFILSRELYNLLTADNVALITVTLQNNLALLSTLIQYFKTNALQMIESDFTSDIKALEEQLQRILPNLELLDLEPQNIAIAMLARDVKDLRKILLQLVMALPKT